MRPLIGITAEYANASYNGSVTPSHLCNRFYVRAVQKAGGLPVVLPVSPPEDAGELLDRIDGLLVTGGVDVDPKFYGAEAGPMTGSLGGTDSARDECEGELCRGAVERNLPTLAICRGIQSLNVALGGTLIQHVDDHMRMDLWNETVHTVHIEPGLVAKIVGEGAVETNSLHHQAIDDLGDGCTAAAFAPDGTIEAIEIDHASNVVGVQWHPELIRHRAEHQALFNHLVITSKLQRGV